jgi:hypothetical protein
MTDEQRAARFSRSAAAAGLTEGEDGLLIGAGKGTGALPEVRRAGLMLLEDNPGMTDAEIRAALKPDFGADADRFGSIRLLKRAAGREERAAQARQERMASPAGQRAMIRGGFSPTQARALAGDAEATRALNLGRAGLSSVMQEEEKQRGTAEAAGIAKSSAERVEQIRALSEQGKIDSALEIAKLNNAAAVQKIELMLPYLKDKEHKAMLTAALPAIFAAPDPEAALNQFMQMMGFAEGTIGGTG